MHHGDGGTYTSITRVQTDRETLFKFNFQLYGKRVRASSELLRHKYFIRLFLKLLYGREEEEKKNA